MNFFLNLIIAVIYILALLFSAFIVIAPLTGIGVWSQGDDGIGYAWEIPLSIRVICFILLILLLSGGLYFLWRNIPRFN